MATNSLDTLIELCNCSICLENLKIPKQLPCLHRFCRECLQQCIEEHQGVINCPECRQEIIIPENGVDGFKTDFFVNTIIEYITRIESLKKDNNKIKECGGCSETKEMSSYCFKCMEFLCYNCHQNHMKSKLFKDHLASVVDLKNSDDSKLGIDKLPELSESPRCDIHPEQISRLCCKSCNNLIICLVCGFGRHKNHDTEDIEITAEELNDKLKEESQRLQENKDHIYKLPQILQIKEVNIKITAKEIKSNIQSLGEENIAVFGTLENKINEKYDIKTTKEENTHKEEMKKIQKDMDFKIQQIRDESDKLFSEAKKQTNDILQKLTVTRDEQLTKLKFKQESLVENMTELKTSVGTLEIKKLNDIIKISENVNNTLKRHENITSTVSCLQSTANDWTAVQCIPDISTAIEQLIKDITEGFPELETILQFPNYTLQSVNLHQLGSIQISKKEEYVTDIDGIKSNCWCIDDITSFSAGDIIISGRCCSLNMCSYITVINMNGKQRQQQRQQQTQSLLPPSRYCAALSPHQVVTVCKPNEIGIYDVRDGSYINKNINDITTIWPVGRLVSCVATDLAHKRIIVGSVNSKDVYMFDENLNYCQTLTITDITKGLHDMTVSESNIHALDYHGNKAFTVNMNGELQYYFKKPQLNGIDWYPCSVCTDKNGFIYMLYDAHGDNLALAYSESDSIFVQYSRDGGHIITVRQVDKDASCITTVTTPQEAEKLLMATWGTGKLIVYGLDFEMNQD